VTGEVSVTQDELNNLDGLTENVQGALPEAPTVDGSVIHNNGSRWAETNVLEIKGDAAFIPAFAGMGNLVVYVDNNGQIQAADMADTPEIQHPLNAHTDVSYVTAPKEDDILMFNGTEWVNTPNRTGNMFKPCNQSRSVGGGFMYDGNYGYKSSQKDGDDWYRFTVPNGVRFALISVIASGQYNQAGVGAQIVIDGITTNSIGHLQSKWPSWAVGAEGTSGPLIEVKDKIEVKWDGSEDNIAIDGYFFEV
jgi:hypothetical protein